MASVLRGLWGAYERQLSSKPIPTQMATSCVLWCIGDYMAQRIEHYEESVYGKNKSSKALSNQQNDSNVTPQPAPLLQQQQQQQHMRVEDVAHQHTQSAAGQLLSQQQQQQQHQPIPSSSSFVLDRRRILLTSAFGAGFIGPVGHLWYEGIEKVCRKLVPSGGVRFLATKVVLDSAIMGSVYVIAFFAYIATALEGTGLDGFVHKMKVDFVPTYAAELAFWPVVQTLNFSQVPVRHQLLVVNTFSLLDAAFISWVGNQEDWSGKILDRLGWSRDKPKQA